MMTKLAILSLTAAALIPAAALAQTVQPPVPWEDVPPTRLDAPPPPPGTTWERKRPAPPAPIVTQQGPVRVEVRQMPAPAPMPPMAPPPPVVVRQGMAPMPPAPPAQVRAQSRRVVVVKRDGGMGHHVQGYHRFAPGARVPAGWWGPQYDVAHWNMYGFAPPMPDERWIRYYDDALLIDGDGTVIDCMPDVDWDRYGERWAYDDQGVPYYVGAGDYRPGARDYAYVQGYAPPPGGEVVEEGYAPPPSPYPPAYPAYPGYGYGSYGYGYAPGGMITVTETTVVTGGCCGTKVRRRHGPHRHFRKCVRSCPAPMPAPPPPVYDGERG